MKKLFWILMGCLAQGYGLYYGSPNLPDTAQEGFFISKACSFGLKVGYQGDFILDQSFKSTNTHTVRKVDNAHYYMQQGVLTGNFIDRFEVFLSAGEIKFHTQAKVSSHIQQVYETGNRFTWGFGGRGILFTFSQAALGLDFKYQLASPHIQWVTQNGVPLVLSRDPKMSYREWQLALGLSYTTEIFTPYIGATYCQSKLKYKNFLEGVLPGNKLHFTVKSRKKFGMAVGTTLSTGKIFELDLEARLINETALSIAGNIRF